MLIMLIFSGPLFAQGNYKQKIEDWLANQGFGETLEIQQVNIFGDGDPSNGVEDNRIDMSSPQWNSENRRGWNMGAGTIHCDGKNRGSAVIVDTSELGNLKRGLIVATSAHVLFDLGKKRLFSSCQFHFMALDYLPGYKADIEFAMSRIGGFDPYSPRDSSNFGKEDWAFLYINDLAPGMSPTGSLQLRAFNHGLPPQKGAVEYQFIAYSQSVDAITISTVCQVRESAGNDIGGGGWPGQLLDDCDSEGGASGGGLVATNTGHHYLVGIRSGSHWDGDTFPANKYPHGPPDGAAWDISRNTNFSRAIDLELIENLRSLVEEINSKIRPRVFF